MKKKSRVPKRKKSVSRLTPDIKEVALPPSGIVRVVVPSGVVPVVAVDPVKRVVEIVPVKREKKTWWQSLWE